MFRRISCMTVLKYQDQRHPYPSSEDIAKMLAKSEKLECPMERFTEIVDDMLVAASRYKNLELALQSPGITLVLGNNISETS
jgi:hypothetical protein